MLDFSRFKFKIFLLEIIFYIAAFTIGILSVLRIKEIVLAQKEIARRIADSLPNTQPDLPPDLVNVGSLTTPEYITIAQFLIAFLFATLFFLFLIKTKYGGKVLKMLFVLAIFAGAEIIFQVWVSQELALVFAFILILFRFMIPRVIVHDIAIIVAITGIAINFGLNIDPFQAVLLLIAISIYDFIAVYVTKHMVKMFNSTVSLGTIFAMIIPDKFSNLAKTVREVGRGKDLSAHRFVPNDFVYLGGGDLAFPLILVVSAAIKFGVRSAVFAAIGALVGLFVLNVIFMMQKERRPMPAMPPLAAGVILGFFASLINK